NSFGITVAVAIGMSLVIAITFTPMLCSRFLRPHRQQGGLEPPELIGGTWINRVMHRGYGWMVSFSMRHKWVIIVGAVGCILAIVPLFKAVGKDFLALDDRGEFNVVVQTPPGSTLEKSDAIMQELEARIRKLPHVVHELTTIGDTGNGNQD